MSIYIYIYIYYLSYKCNFNGSFLHERKCYYTSSFDFLDIFLLYNWNRFACTFCYF